MQTFEIQYNGETFHFDMTAEKVGTVVKENKWKATQWSVTVTQREYGGMIAFDFFTGTAIKDCEISSVMQTIALDSSMAEEMPEDDIAAMDHYESNFGQCEKSSEVLRIVRAVRKMRNDAQKMLANTGITLSEFCEACSED